MLLQESLQKVSFSYLRSDSRIPSFFYKDVMSRALIINEEKGAGVRRITLASAGTSSLISYIQRWFLKNVTLAPIKNSRKKEKLFMAAAVLYLPHL